MNGPRIFWNPRAQAPSPRFTDFVNRDPLLKEHCLFQTSGSKGYPKWVALSTAALEASARAVNEHLRVERGDVFGLALPDFHVGGFGVMERSRISGCPMERLERWSAKDFAKWVEGCEISITSLVPTQIYDLCHENLVAPKSLRAVVVGGGGLPLTLFQKARCLRWPLLPSYGLSECASQVATASLSTLDGPDSEGEIFGEILSHMKLTEVERHVFSVQSPSLLTAYVIERENEIEILDPKTAGSFVLPDRLELRGRYLRVLGRRETEYKVLGEWIRWDFMRQLFDDLALKHSCFSDVQLRIVPDERSGNVVALVCDQRMGNLHELVRQLISEFNREVFPIERITHLSVASLARSALGKIQFENIDPICLQEFSG